MQAEGLAENRKFGTEVCGALHEHQADHELAIYPGAIKSHQPPGVH